MKEVIDGVSVDYDYKIAKGVTLIFLHGWGCDKTIFSSIIARLKGYTTLAIDLPGFGESSYPCAKFTLDDYANVVITLIARLDIHEYIIVGHSFGGRIAIRLMSSRSVANRAPKLIGAVLVDSGGLRPRRKLSYYFAVALYKIGKLFGRKLDTGSVDYKALNDDMKAVFVRIVNTYQDNELSLVGCPLLVIWGERDKETPLYMARRLAKVALELHVMSGLGHYCFLQDPSQFVTKLTIFVGKVCSATKALHS